MNSPSSATNTAAIAVVVKLFAAYQEAYGQGELNLEVPANMTVGELRERLIAEKPDLARWRDVTRFGVNLDFVSGDRQLQPGDEVVFIPPVSGG